MLRRLRYLEASFGMSFPQVKSACFDHSGSRESCEKEKPNGGKVSYWERYWVVRSGGRHEPKTIFKKLFKYSSILNIYFNIYIKYKYVLMFNLIFKKYLFIFAGS